MADAIDDKSMKVRLTPDVVFGVSGASAAGTFRPKRFSAVTVDLLITFRP
jgi:hypothetical protein